MQAESELSLAGLGEGAKSGPGLLHPVVSPQMQLLLQASYNTAKSWLGRQLICTFTHRIGHALGGGQSGTGLVPATTGVDPQATNKRLTATILTNVFMTLLLLFGFLSSKLVLSEGIAPTRRMWAKCEPGGFRNHPKGWL